MSIGCFALSLGIIASAAEPERAEVMSIEAPLRIRLRWVPSGGFEMGDLADVGQRDEKPVHRVSISGFWMMETEVTVGMYELFATTTQRTSDETCWVFEEGWREEPGLSWRNPGFAQTSLDPVTCVSHADSNAFATWLSEVTGMTFELPSEAEWEYAARAGTTTRYFHGDDVSRLCEFSNGADQSALEAYPSFTVNDCNDGAVRTSPVAGYTPNGWGLYDMTGNLWEWVSDCWSSSYLGHSSDGAPFRTEGCQRRVFRGGGYGDIPSYLRIALRNRGNAHHRKDDIGFRLVVRR